MQRCLLKRKDRSATQMMRLPPWKKYLKSGHIMVRERPTEVMYIILRCFQRMRIRIHICQKRMTCRQADQLEYFLSGLEGVTAVKVVERNQDAVICYNGDKLAILKAVQKFSYGASEAPESYLQNSGREMNSEY
mgnify:CR=1 FL=1